MIETFEDNCGARAGILGSTLVFHHYGPVTAGSVEVIRRSMLRLASLSAASPAQLVIMDDGLPTPEGDVRKELIKLVNSNLANARALAVVSLGKGFMAAAMRAALVGMKLVIGTPLPISVFGTVAEATSWLAKHTGANAEA